MMDKIDMISIKFPNATLFCVGSVNGINNILLHIKTIDRNGNNFTIDSLLNRCFIHNIYSYIKPNGYKLKKECNHFNYELEKHGLLINENQIDEAMLLAKPKEVMKLLDITKDQYEKIKKESFWKDKFDINVLI